MRATPARHRGHPNRSEPGCRGRRSRRSWLLGHAGKGPSGRAGTRAHRLVDSRATSRSGTGEEGSCPVRGRCRRPSHGLVVGVTVSPVWRDDDGVASVTEQCDDRGSDPVEVLIDLPMGTSRLVTRDSSTPRALAAASSSRRRLRARAAGVCVGEAGCEPSPAVATTKLVGMPWAVAVPINPPAPRVSSSGCAATTTTRATPERSNVGSPAASAHSVHSAAGVPASSCVKDLTRAPLAVPSGAPDSRGQPHRALRGAASRSSRRSLTRCACSSVVGQWRRSHRVVGDADDRVDRLGNHAAGSHRHQLIRLTRLRAGGSIGLDRRGAQGLASCAECKVELSHLQLRDLVRRARSHGA